MMKARTPFLVGLVVLIGAAAFVFTFGSLDKGMNLEQSYAVDAVFDDATGLVLRSRVTLSGIPVGEITDIKLDPNSPDKARVTMRVRKDVVLHEGLLDEATGMWRNGAAAMRLQASLLGDYYIAVSPGVAGPPIGPGGEIRNVVTESGLGAILDQLEESSATVFPKLEQITTDIAEVTGAIRQTMGGEEGVRTLNKIKGDVSTTTGEVAALSTEVRTFMNDKIFPESAQVSRILSNVASATARLDQAAARTDRRLMEILGNVDTLTAELKDFVSYQTQRPEEAPDGTLASAIAQADKDLVVLEGSLENVRSVTERMDKGEGTVGRLLRDETLIDEVEGVVADVRELTSTITDLQIKVEIRSEYLFLQNSLKNYVNLSLHPKPDKYYFFQIVDDPAGKRTISQRVTTSNDPSKPPVLVEDIILTEDALKFTAQFAKKWHFLTFRYGVMESSGGWGIDAEFLDDTLRFKMDFFEFGRDDWPRMRLMAAWEFFDHLYISGGVDEILNQETRDYFVGLGVIFTDDDLKGILPFLPSL